MGVISILTLLSVLTFVTLVTCCAGQEVRRVHSSDMDGFKNGLIEYDNKPKFSLLPMLGIQADHLFDDWDNKSFIRTQSNGMDISTTKHQNGGGTTKDDLVTIQKHDNEIQNFPDVIIKSGMKHSPDRPSLYVRERKHIIKTVKKVIGKTVEKIKDLFQQFKDFVFGKRNADRISDTILKSLGEDMAERGLSLRDRRHVVDAAKKVIGKTVEKVKDFFQQLKDFFLGKRDVDRASEIILQSVILSSRLGDRNLSLRHKRHIIDTAKKVIGKTVEKVKDFLQQLKDLISGKRNV